jgi:hypothetical protein
MAMPETSRETPTETPKPLKIGSGLAGPGRPKADMTEIKAIMRLPASERTTKARELAEQNYFVAALQALRIGRVASKRDMHTYQQVSTIAAIWFDKAFGKQDASVVQVSIPSGVQAAFALCLQQSVSPTTQPLDITPSTPANQSEGPVGTA